MSDTLEIKDQDYRVWYEPSDHTVYFEGKMRLAPGGYRPIEELLQRVVETGPNRIRLHLFHLQFLNSSGLSTLFKFVVQLRKLGTITLAVQASKEVLWHSKTLSNIERFFPDAEIELA